MHASKIAKEATKDSSFQNSGFEEESTESVMDMPAVQTASISNSTPPDDDGNENTQSGPKNKLSFGEKLMRTMQPMGNRRIQMKSNIELGQPGDKYEKEADAVADKVMRTSDTRESTNEQTESSLKISRTSNGIGGGNSVPQNVEKGISNTKGTGQSLPVNTKQDLGVKIGADFSNVKIHTDSQAAELSNSINAKAFTYGNDIYFNDGEYNPDTSEGKGLLAHELTHTVQQSNVLNKKVQASLKFEIQTYNFLWQMDGHGVVKYIPRKLGNEDGSAATYIAKGKRGAETQSVGDIIYREAVGDEIMRKGTTNEYVEPETGLDESKNAQYIVTVLVKNLNDYLVSSKTPDKADITEINKVDNSATSVGGTDFVPDTYEFRYYDYDVYNKERADTTNTKFSSFLDVHRNKQGIFKPGHKKFMMQKMPDFDIAKSAQIEKNYKFKVAVTEGDLIGKEVVEGDLELVSQKNNAHKGVPYEPNTFQLKYFDNTGKELFIHLDKKRKFAKGIVKFMTVDFDSPKGVSEEKSSQYIETWKVTLLPKSIDYNYPEDAIGYYDPISNEDRLVTLEHITDLDIDNSKTGNPYNAGMYEKKYYLSSDFSGNILNTGALMLNVHLSLNGDLIAPHVKSMESVQVKKKKEQTAIELQAESHGFIEFETPKWFNNWEELRQRVQDAFEMTQAMNNSPEVTDSNILSKMQAAKKKNDRSSVARSPLGKIHEWPTSFGSRSSALKNAIGSNKLYVEIADPDWNAFFQTSEGIPLSEVPYLINDYSIYGEQYNPSYIKPYVDKIFNNIKPTSSVATIDDSLFNELKGFLHLILAYITWGQTQEQRGHKDTFPVMARTDFGSMYSSLLSDNEKILYSEIINHSSAPIFSSDVEDGINDIRINDIGLATNITLNKSTLFFAGGHSGGVTKNPTINQWLLDIVKGKDLLSGNQVNVADAIGGRKVNEERGNKDYKHAMFEKRFSHKLKASEWVGFAEDMYKKALTRTYDTPDNPTTVKETVQSGNGTKEKDINEASKTSIK